MSRTLKTANVPKVPAGLERSLAHFLNGVKESIEVSRGRAGEQESFVTKKYLEEKGYATDISETTTVSNNNLSGSTTTRQSLGTHEVQTINIADRAVTEVKIAEGAILTRLDVLDMLSAFDGTYLLVAVADITAPIELGDYSSIDGSLLVAYEVDANQDLYTIYAFDSANASGASSPYVVAGLAGFWVAVSGKYQKGDINVTDDVNIGGTLTLGAGLDEFTISEATDDITIKNTISDKDIILNVNDGGSDVEVARFVGADRSMKFHASSELNLQQCNASQTLATDANKNVVSTTIAEPFPINSIYISIVATNPNTTLGYGTWTALTQGHVLVSAGAAFTPITGPAGPTIYGALNHLHNVPARAAFNSGSTAPGLNGTSSASSAASSGAPNSYGTIKDGTGASFNVPLDTHTHTIAHTHTVGTLSVNNHLHTVTVPTVNTASTANLPLSFAVYMWLRTA